MGVKYADRPHRGGTTAVLPISSSGTCSSSPDSSGVVSFVAGSGSRKGTCTGTSPSGADSSCLSSGSGCGKGIRTDTVVGRREPHLPLQNVPSLSFGFEVHFGNKHSHVGFGWWCA